MPLSPSGFPLDSSNFIFISAFQGRIIHQFSRLFLGLDFVVLAIDRNFGAWFHTLSSVRISLKRTYQVSIGAVCSRTLIRRLRRVDRRCRGWRFPGPKSGSEPASEAATSP